MAKIAIHASEILKIPLILKIMILTETPKRPIPIAEFPSWRKSQSARVKS